MQPYVLNSVPIRPQLILFLTGWNEGGWESDGEMKSVVRNGKMVLAININLFKIILFSLTV